MFYIPYNETKRKGNLMDPHFTFIIDLENQRWYHRIFRIKPKHKFAAACICGFVSPHCDDEVIAMGFKWAHEKDVGI